MSIKIILTAFLICLSTPSVWAQAPDRGFIDSPSAFVSGIGFISGWKCNTTDIALKMYCSPHLYDLDPAQNMLRSDTREVCDGRIDNGWIIQVNWEDWAGCTRVDALDNGQQFASREFTVGEVGDGFIRDQEGTPIKVYGFPSPDQVTLFAWSTATQHFEGMYTTDCHPDDACPGSGGQNTPAPGNPPVPYPEMIVVDGAYAGDQALIQYKGMLALPPPTRESLVIGATTGQRSNKVVYYSSIAHSIIFEPDTWMVTRTLGGAEVRIPKEDLPERLNEVEKIYTNTPLLKEIMGAIIFNMTGVGGSVNAFDGEDEDVETFINRQDLAYKGGEQIQFFINKGTAEIGFKLVPYNLNKAGDGWLDAIGVANVRRPSEREGNRNRIKAVDSWWLEVAFPNQGRGPWRGVGGWNVAIRLGHIFPDMQSSFQFSRARLSSRASPLPPYATDLTGTGKLEIIWMSAEQYNAWQSKDNLSQFIRPEFEFGSVVD